MDNPNVYSVEMKLAKIEEFAKSGQSIKAFADANGIPHGTFWGWVEKARSSGMEGLPPRMPMAAPSLPPVDITKEMKPSAKRGPKASGPKASCKVGGARFTFPAEMLIEVIRELQPK